MSGARRGRYVAPLLLLVVVGLVGFVYLRGDRKGKATGTGAEADSQRAAHVARPWEFGDDPSLPTGVIEGIVRDADGKPLDGASVFLTRARPRDVPNYEPPKPMSAAVTAGGGGFRFDKVPPGDYGVAALLAGHAPGNRTPLELEPRQTLQVDVTLGRGGVVLSGRVLDDAGGPLPGARVVAVEYGNAFASDQRAVPRVFQAVAADDGRYALPLAAGSYGLTAEADGYARGRAWVRLARDHQKDIRLTPAARIVGRVVEGTEKTPVPGATVSLQTITRFGGQARQAITNEEGVFKFDDLEAGTFQVGARRGRGVGAGVVVGVGAAQTTDGVEVKLSSAAVVSGRVLSLDGKPVGSAAVQIEREQPPFEPGIFGKTAPDGTFALEGVLPGRYSLRGEADGHGRERVTVEVKASDLEGLVMKLGTESVVSGKVVDASGNPVEGAKVAAYVEQSGANARSTSRGTTSGAGGLFEIKRITRGSVTIAAEHREAGLAEQRVGTLKPGEKREVTVALAAGASISGTVKYEDGKPAVGAEVSGFPRTMGPGPRLGHASDSTDAEGRFTLAPLPKATMMVHARIGGATVFGGPDDPARKTIEIEAGEAKTGIDLVIKRSDQSISGVVLDPDGKPIGGATVLANVDRGGDFGARKASYSQLRVTTMDDGSFTLEGLTTANYFLWATHPRFADGEARGVASGATDARIQLAKPAAVSGVVVGSDGRAITTFQISLLPGAPPGETPEQMRRRTSGPTVWEAPMLRVHDASGAFAFSNLEAGSYELQVQTADGQIGKHAVELAAGESKQGVRIAMEAGTELTGRAVDLETGQPLPHARVFGRGGGNEFREQADAVGAFRIRGVAPGPVTINVSSAERGHVGESKEIEVTKGPPTIDLGIFKLMKGDWQERVGPDGRPASPGVFVKADSAGKLAVQRVLPDTPAAKAGIKQGDVVTAIDGRDVTQIGPGAARFLMAGKAGTEVKLTVASAGGEPRTVALQREQWKPPVPATGDPKKAPPKRTTASTVSTTPVSTPPRTQ